MSPGLGGVHQGALEQATRGLPRGDSGTRRTKEAASDLKSRKTSHQSSLNAAKEQAKETSNTLKTKTADVQNDLGVANEILAKRVEDLTNDLAAVQTRLELVEREKMEALEKLEMIQNKSMVDLKEDTLNVETNEGITEVESLQSKADAVEERKEKMSKAHAKTTATSNNQTADVQKKLAIQEGEESNERAQEHVESENRDNCPCFWCPELLLSRFRKGSTGDLHRTSAVTPLSPQM